MKAPQLSFWDKDRLQEQVDFLIVGGGITGLSCAWRIHQLAPHASIRVIDKHNLTRIASTRNAGFSCFGSLTEIIDDIQNFGADVALDLVERRYKGIQLIRSSFSDELIYYRGTGGFELIDGHAWSELELKAECQTINVLLSSIFKADVFQVLSKKAAFGFSDHVHVVANHLEGQLDPARYVYELSKRLPSAMVEILSGVEVTSFESDVKGVLIRTNAGNMRAGQIVLATNGLTSQLQSHSPLIKPARNMILVSEPDMTKLDGVFHADRGYIYFRNIGSRLLIGGGRHINLEAEETFEFGINDDIRTYLKNYVHDIISPKKEIKFEMEWSGIMGIPKNKTPLIKKIQKNIFVAAGFGGMGVALGMQGGHECAELIFNRN